MMPVQLSDWTLVSEKKPETALEGEEEPNQECFPKFVAKIRDICQLICKSQPTPSNPKGNCHSAPLIPL
jgi:hypothetical protein